MALITRQEKGSKLSIEEMDGNLTYLEQIAKEGGGGLSGTQYVFVAADGTDLENAQELQEAYNEAKTKVSVIENISGNLLVEAGITIYYDYNDIVITQTSYDIPLGLNSFEVISDSGTEILEFDVLEYYPEFQYMAFYSKVSRTNVTSLKFRKMIIKRGTVIASPSYYNFTSDFLMDEEYVDLVSLDGNRSVVFNGEGTISITANDVFVKGVDVLSKPFKIGDDLNLLKVENCRGGYYSFGKISSGTFTNCQGGRYSFGSEIASGTFTNCQGDYYSFGTISSGTFTNCRGDGVSFGTEIASGTFNNCTASYGFGFSGIASGIFTNCTTIIGFGGNSEASGTFTNCIAEEPFNASFGRVASGIFTNCIGKGPSFGPYNSASGTFTNCQGGLYSFAGLSSQTTLTGKLYYCRLTVGTFGTVSGGGITRLCIDGNNNQDNQG